MTTIQKESLTTNFLFLDVNYEFFNNQNNTSNNLFIIKDVSYVVSNKNKIKEIYSTEILNDLNKYNFLLPKDFNYENKKNSIEPKVLKRFILFKINQEKLNLSFLENKKNVIFNFLYNDSIIFKNNILDEVIPSFKYKLINLFNYNKHNLKFNKEYYQKNKKKYLINFEPIFLEKEIKTYLSFYNIHNYIKMYFIEN